MNREIPGFYYDSVKRKYFRIEENKTAPAGAGWSKENVKRRLAEKKEGEEKERREARKRQGIKRAEALSDGILMREVNPEGTKCEDGPVKLWASGLRERGKKTLWYLAEEDQAMVSTMWVGADEESGSGIVVAGLGSTYCPAYAEIVRDEDDRIDDRAWRKYPLTGYPVYGYISSIKVHEPSHTILMAGPNINGESRVVARQSMPGSTQGTTWLAPSGSRMVHAFPNATIPQVEINACEIASSSSWGSPTAVLGTSRGLYHYGSGDISPLTRENSRQRKQHPKYRPPFHGDVLSVDYLDPSSSDDRKILAGTRSGHICLVDSRTSPAEWETSIFKHTSSVSHLKSLSYTGKPHEILAAGPRSAMAIYDVRSLLKRHSQDHPVGTHEGGAKWDRPALPVVRFPEYRNEAHIQTGLDVLAEPGYGCGVVAAAHDDFTVGVYSMRDGSRLDAGDVDKIKAPGVVKSLAWKRLPGDGHPSLFVGVGSVIKKYSF